MRKRFFVIALSLALTGCPSSYRPNPPVSASVFSTPYIADLSSANLFTVYNALPEGPAKVARRNQIIWEIMWLTDQNYGSFENSFFAGQAYVATGADVLNIALSSAAAVTGTAHLKSILAVVSGGIVGIRASYTKNFFDQGSREAIVQVMRAARLAKRVEIEAGMATCSTSVPCGTNGAAYSLETGLLDAGEYFDAGTVIGALLSISQSSSQQAVAARAAMRTIRRNP